MPSVTYTDREIEDLEAAAFENGMQTALANNSRAVPCPAYLAGEHCVVLRVAKCPDEPCDLSR